MMPWTTSRRTASTLFWSATNFLLDLSVNYQKEQLYQEWLTPLTQQAETLSELLTEPEDETSDPSKP